MSSPKILLINGSPRKNGNTTRLVQEITRGIESHRGQYEIIRIQDLTIKPCTACDACIKAKNLTCILKDDMIPLYPKLIEAEIIVFATPIYWFTFPAQIKAFIDRLYALHTKDGGFALKGKKFALLIVYGAEDPYDAGAVNAIHAFQDMCRYMKGSIIDILYGTANDAGDVEKNTEFLKKAFALGEKCVTGKEKDGS